MVAPLEELRREVQLQMDQSNSLLEPLVGRLDMLQQQLQESVAKSVEAAYRDDVEPAAREYLQSNMSEEVRVEARLSRETVIEQLTKQLDATLRGCVSHCIFTTRDEAYGNSSHEFCSSVAAREAPRLLGEILRDEDPS